MISDKKTVKILAEMCLAEGIHQVIVSPGSRNAPLVLTLSAMEAFHCHVIVDERSAAFFALGMAQQTGKPVALVCTSGTAVLNYAPAIAEAYYQQVPLLVITADRPQEWIDQADGQTIRQDGIYNHYVRHSCSLRADVLTPDDEWLTERLIADALLTFRKGVPGPVHINVPLREPLYGRTVHQQKRVHRVAYAGGITQLHDEVLDDLAHRWSATERVMILMGMHRPDEGLQQVLEQLQQRERVVVLTESLSNMTGDGFIRCIDRVVTSIGDDEAPLFRPDLLITFDGQVLSKMVKTLLRKYPPKEHWHISPSGLSTDTYRHLTQVVAVDPTQFFLQLMPRIEPVNSRYRTMWQKRAEGVATQHDLYVKALPWCDMKVYDSVFAGLTSQTMVQLGNSTPVRYAQLFDVWQGKESYSNRGTSGIDGCVSTAAGASSVRTDKQTLLLTGDLSFFYDSNALWNKHLPDQLKIIIINNGGGGIFRYIPGPSDTEELDEFFATSHTMHAEYITRQFGVDYWRCDDEATLQERLPEFMGHPRVAILEVMTPSKESARVLKGYFEALKKCRY